MRNELWKKYGRHPPPEIAFEGIALQSKNAVMDHLVNRFWTLMTLIAALVMNSKLVMLEETRECATVMLKLMVIL